MNWRKLFFISYWMRGRDFNVFTFLLDIYIIMVVLFLLFYLGFVVFVSVRYCF